MKKIFIIIVFLLSLTGVCFSQASKANCPTISVVGPSRIMNEGETMKFAIVVGLVSPRLNYKWKVENGQIINGQGTSEITVSGGEGNSIVKASVKIDGIPDGCDNSASETAAIAETPSCCFLVSWGSLKPDDERDHLDLFFAELQNNPTDTGLIVLAITNKEKLNLTNSRIRFVIKHAKFRKFDFIRLKFTLALSDEQLTTLFRIPIGGELPCEKCLVINGGDLK